jgi:hypothetical protein
MSMIIAKDMIKAEIDLKQLAPQTQAVGVASRNENRHQSFDRLFVCEQKGYQQKN